MQMEKNNCLLIYCWSHCRHPSLNLNCTLNTANILIILYYVCSWKRNHFQSFPINNQVRFKFPFSFSLYSLQQNRGGKSWVCAGMCVEARGKLPGAGSFLACGAWAPAIKFNSPTLGGKALPTESAWRPRLPHSLRSRLCWGLLSLLSTAQCPSLPAWAFQLDCNFHYEKS